MSTGEYVQSVKLAQVEACAAFADQQAEAAAVLGQIRLEIEAQASKGDGMNDVSKAWCDALTTAQRCTYDSAASWRDIARTLRSRINKEGATDGEA